MILKIVKIAVVVLLTFYVTAFRAEAQEAQQEKKKPDNDKPDHNHQTYTKIGVVHAGTTVEGFNIVINGLSIDIETHFNLVKSPDGDNMVGKNHIGLSGWFVGYRKDDLRYSDFGHLLNAGVFRTVNLPALDLRLAGGAEWGIISPNFSKTRFSHNNGALVSYEHLFPYRNTDIPGLGPSHDSTLYPFVEISVLKRWRWLLVETGVRGNIQKFGFDRYVLNSDNLIFIASNKTRIIPAVFAKVGIALP